MNGMALAGERRWRVSVRSVLLGAAAGLTVSVWFSLFLAMMTREICR